jgi:hypothetical protein
MTHVPWIGLAALGAMFVIPFLPSWLFEGPRTVKHWPRRHVCGACGAPWTADHTCPPAAPPARPLRGEVVRLRPPTERNRVVMGRPSRRQVLSRGR